MIVLLPTLLLAAAPIQSAPVDQAAAARVLDAVNAALAAKTATVECWPSPHYAGADPCHRQIAEIPRLDLRRLVWFNVVPCNRDAPNRLCAGFAFDLGRSDGSRATLIVETASTGLRNSADVAKVVITQGLQTSD